MTVLHINCNNVSKIYILLLFSKIRKLFDFFKRFHVMNKVFKVVLSKSLSIYVRRGSEL